MLLLSKSQYCGTEAMVRHSVWNNIGVDQSLVSVEEQMVRARTE